MSLQNTLSIHPVLLITGVSGYVGHHILRFVHQTYPSYTVYATHHSRNPSIKSDDALKKINYIKLDLTDDQSINTAVANMFNNNIIPQIIIHCAAITSPPICQKNKEKAMKVNYSTVLVQSLLSNYYKLKLKKDPLFIFFSTDHVYDGELLHSNTIKHASINNETESKMDRNILYDEESPCYPINNYGESKLIMEKYLLMHWNNLVILRCSVIFGPYNETKSTLLQFVVNSLNDDKNKEVILFKNEKRNFVCIWSVIKCVQYFINDYYEGGDDKEYHDVYNCGGRESLSRLEFGEISGKIYALDTQKIKAMNRSDCKESWAHGAPNPQDVSMSSAKLYKELKEHYMFPEFIDLINQIKAHEGNK